MTDNVASQTAYAALTLEKLSVSGQTAYVAIFPGDHMAVSSQTAYVAILPIASTTKKRRSVIVIAS